MGDMLYAGTLFVLITTAASFQHHAQIFNAASNVDNVYRGTVKESDVDVEISPGIRVSDGSGPICAYLLENYDEKNVSISRPVPFTVRVTDRQTGSARISVIPGQHLDCSDPLYKFFIRARRCVDDKLLDRALVEVKVEDTNNHEPQFEQSWYNVEIEENRIYDAILLVKANDADCGHPYGEICRYEITNDDNVRHLFHVSESGILRNVKALNASSLDSYLITVTAHDCGMRRSTKPAVVTVKIHRQPQSDRQRKPTTDPKPSTSKSVADPLNIMNSAGDCRNELVDVPFQLDYLAGRGALPLFSAARLRICGAADQCPNPQSGIEAKLTLNADWRQNSDAKSCDRENLSIDLQRKLCNIDKNTVELLPSSKNIHIENEAVGAGGNDTNSAMNSAEEEVFVFDGNSNAVIVAESTLSPTHWSENFTFNFWMKREKPQESNNNDQNSHHRFGKETILCLSDDHRLNRHHFAVYAKKCKLEVLFRREKASGVKKRQKRLKNRLKRDSSSPDQSEDDDLYEPAEWRWHLDQVCDNSWHHYSLNVKFPTINLYVDGISVEDVGESAEILDDWPMHHIRDMRNRLVVGACWQGGVGKMTQHFRGYLSGLTLLPQKLERPNVLQCLMQCKERLEFVDLDQMKIGEEAIFNRDMSELTLKAKNAQDFADMLRKVSYLNSRSNPTFGDRFVRIIVTVNCEGQPLPVLFPIVESKISVIGGPEVTSLRLHGQRHLVEYSRSEVAEKGVALFPDLKIYLVQTLSDSKTQHRELDYCKIISEPHMDKSREFFSSPSNLIARLPDLDFEHVNDGLLFKGRANYKDFEKILQQVHYFNSRPEEFPERVFTVFCSMYGGKLESNRFDVTLKIDMKKTTAAPSTGQAKGEQIQLVPISAPHRVVAKKKPLVAPPSEMMSADSPPSYSNSAKKLGVLSTEPKLESMAYEPFSPALQAGPGGTLAVVMVICVCFLVILLAVGALKMRATRRRLAKQRRQRRFSSIDDGGDGAAAAATPTRSGAGTCAGLLSCGAGGNDLTWDDAGMTIIVNPIEQGNDLSIRSKAKDSTYSEMSSDEDSFRDDDESGEDEFDDDDSGDQVLPHLESNAVVGGGAQPRNAGALEWDDEAALTDSAAARRRANLSTYRV